MRSLLIRSLFVVLYVLVMLLTGIAGRRPVHGSVLIWGRREFRAGTNPCYVFSALLVGSLVEPGLEARYSLYSGGSDLGLRLFGSC